MADLRFDRSVLPAREACRHSRRQAASYVGLVFAFSLVFYFLILRSGSNGLGLYTLGLMWCPALAGLLTLRLNGRSIAELGWRWGKTKYQLWSWFVPLLYATIAYGIVWTAGFGGFPNRDFLEALVKGMHVGGPRWISIALGLALTGSYGLIRGLSSALGEEMGWRGFFVPELARTRSYTATALISGSIWALWHYPILIFGKYNAGTPTWYGVTCFTVMVVSISFVFAWMRLKSGSLWTGAILHASHNLYIQAIFTPLTHDTGSTAWFIDEFGCVLPIVTAVFAIYFWSRRNELQVPGETEAPVRSDDVSPM